MAVEYKSVHSGGYWRIGRHVDGRMVATLGSFRSGSVAVAFARELNLAVRTGYNQAVKEVAEYAAVDFEGDDPALEIAKDMAAKGQ